MLNVHISLPQLTTSYFCFRRTGLDLKQLWDVTPCWHSPSYQQKGCHDGQTHPSAGRVQVIRQVGHIGTPSTLCNSLAPGRFETKFWQVILKLTLEIHGWDSSSKIALRWMSLDLTDDKSTLIQVMAWCRQAASHYLGQCRVLTQSYGITRPQRDKPQRPLL